jgi:hypothetical protein
VLFHLIIVDGELSKIFILLLKSCYYVASFFDETNSVLPFDSEQFTLKKSTKLMTSAYNYDYQMEEFVIGEMR